MTTPGAAVTAAAVALPRHRRPTRAGPVAEAWHDEDVVTLATEAALAVVGPTTAPPAALVLATVSGPFAEGGNAQVLAEVLELADDDLFVLESGGSLAAGGAGLVTACALVSTGRAPVLVVAADRRRGPRGQPLGDAAVALLLDRADAVDDDDVVARLAHRDSAATVVRDRWRLDPVGRATDDPSAVIRAERSLARVLDDPGRRPGDATTRTTVTARTTIDRVGDAGCATFLLALLRDLADGDGTATVTASGVTHRFDVTAGPAAARVAAATRDAIGAGVDEPVPPAVHHDGFDPYASQARSWRERAQDLRLAGQRDPDTGEVLYPPVPEATADGLEPVRLARHGTVLTATRDHIVPLGPPLSMAVVSLDGGGRFYGPVVDGREVTLGDRVSLVLRRLHDGGGLPQWFWKVRPGAGATHDADR